MRRPSMSEFFTNMNQPMPWRTRSIKSWWSIFGGVLPFARTAAAITVSRGVDWSTNHPVRMIITTTTTTTIITNPGASSFLNFLAAARARDEKAGKMAESGF